MSPISFSDRLQPALTAAIALLIGLLPALHLAALQSATLLILVSVLLRGRLWSLPLRSGALPHLPTLLMAQFALYFTLNALLYPSLPGNMFHFRQVALESWGMTLVGFVLMWVYAGQIAADKRDIWPLLQRWLPLGLLLSFALMSYFFFGPQGNRAKAFATTALTPPIWYLSLTLICFCGFHHMTRRSQILRIGLLLLSAGMALYSGGRAILIIWFIAALCLGLYLILTRPGAQTKGPHSRPNRVLRDLGLLLLALIGIALTLYAIDGLTGGTLEMRIRYTLDHLRSEGLSEKSFFRLTIWDAAGQVIAAHWPWGAGQVNERLLIHEIIQRDWWFRAHQTYLSYLIAGGALALLSGLLFQAAALRFFTSGMLPAGLGLFLVPALSGLTESLFQSLFSVQVYMLLMMLLLTSQLTQAGPADTAHSHSSPAAPPGPADPRH